jgi:hypothetical protein
MIKTQSEEVRQHNIRVICLTIEEQLMSALRKLNLNSRKKSHGQQPDKDKECSSSQKTKLYGRGPAITTSVSPLYYKGLRISLYTMEVE